jgi:hypothetical protein
MSSTQDHVPRLTEALIVGKSPTWAALGLKDLGSGEMPFIALQ